MRRVRVNVTCIHRSRSSTLYLVTAGTFYRIDRLSRFITSYGLIFRARFGEGLHIVAVETSRIFAASSVVAAAGERSSHLSFENDDIVAASLRDVFHGDLVFLNFGPGFSLCRGNDAVICSHHMAASGQLIGA